MRNTKSVIMAILIIIFLIFISKILFMPRGEVLENWNLSQNPEDQTNNQVKFPFMYYPEESGIWYFSTTFTSESRMVNTLHIPRINGYAFSVMLNEETIFQQGDFNYPTANLWNYSFLINLPEEITRDTNRLVIKVYALHDLGFLFPPSIGSKTIFLLINELQNLYSNILTFIMIGANLLTGVLLIMMSFKSSANRRSYIYFGIASLFFTVYSFEYTYRLYTGNLEFFIWLRKFMLASYILSVYYIFKGLLLYLYEKKIPKIFFYFLIIGLIPLFTAGDFINLNSRLKIYNLLIIVISSTMITLFYRYHRNKLIFPVSFFAAAVLHAIIVFTFNLYEITFFMIGISVLMIGIMYNLITEFKAIKNRNITLNQKLITDPMTGAKNRKFLEVLNLQEGDYILFFDFDYFKKFNDTFGHQKGDALLIDFVKKAKEVIRKDDSVIRYGGDEFFISFKSSTETACIKTALILKEYIQSNHELVDLSYGISAYQGSIQDTVKSADVNMYSMKKGKGR
ncbi:MAG: GGDEF domain-containing protein [Spirochaetales bacterium]|nr:GGDEF domain-containing protein [Spirochaetales bacterium]